MKIATCTNRTNLTYRNIEISWDEFLEKLQTTKRTKETVEE